MQATRASNPERLDHERAAFLVESFLRVPVQQTTEPLMQAALATRERFQINYWDDTTVDATVTYVVTEEGRCHGWVGWRRSSSATRGCRRRRVTRRCTGPPRFFPWPHPSSVSTPSACRSCCIGHRSGNGSGKWPPTRPARSTQPAWPVRSRPPCSRRPHRIMPRRSPPRAARWPLSSHGAMAPRP